jgi:SMI1-KNR4 cell-wall
MLIGQRINSAGASKDAIQSLEKTLRCRLPDDYRHFLAEDNGGRPIERLFEVATSNPPSKEAIRAFFGIDGTPKQYDILHQMKQFSGRFPNGLLAIACDSFGNLVLLDLGAKNKGTVYFWDHERESMHEPTWENISPVANSFRAFVDSMH